LICIPGVDKEGQVHKGKEGKDLVKEAKPIYVTQSSKVEELHVENLK
jgi:hypothetical protein